MKENELSDLLSTAEDSAIVDRNAAVGAISFAAYLELVARDPRVADLSHARIDRIVRTAGVTSGADGQPNRYAFWESELYGLERVFHQLMEDYFAPAARRLDVRKRILMLVGPVGGGKSTIATMLKRGLENYSRTDAGASYAIDGCPMHEEPLRLIPEKHRDDFRRRLGVPIEGDLCPRCQWRLDNEWEGKISGVQVRRLLFSERDRRGIGTFKPADPKSQDVAELTGHIDLGKLTDQKFGGESDPRVYRFDGELNIANRGMMEFIEMLKAEPRFLYELNTVAGEQRIKVPQFALISVDLTVLAHTNEYEYDKYFRDPANEAMVDRIFVVKVPYNLRVSEEARIYRKLIEQANLTANGGGDSISPPGLCGWRV